MNVQFDSSVSPRGGAPVRTAAAGSVQASASNGSSLPPAGTALPATANTQSGSGVVSGAQAGRPSDAHKLVAALQTLEKMLAQHVPPLQLTSELQGPYVVAKLVDPQTKAVLYQLPPEQVIRLAEGSGHLAGLMVQTRA